MNKAFKVVIAAVLLVAGSQAWADGHGPVKGLEDSPLKALAVDWVSAGYTGKADLTAMVKENMAEDGVFVPGRYVGFGFQLDGDNDEQVVVARVTPDTPASKVLQEGDVFVSVGGMPATAENRYRMPFRGKPGAPVKAVIKRDGKEMEIEVKRGVIAPRSDKTKVLDNISLGNAEDWPVQSFEIEEVIAEGNVVYVISSYTDVEDQTGLEYTERVVNRFVFNDEGKVAWGAANLGESRFVLEQQGYTISR